MPPGNEKARHVKDALNQVLEHGEALWGLRHRRGRHEQARVGQALPQRRDDGGKNLAKSDRRQSLDLTRHHRNATMTAVFNCEPSLLSDAQADVLLGRELVTLDVLHEP